MKPPLSPSDYRRLELIDPPRVQLDPWRIKLYSGLKYLGAGCRSLVKWLQSTCWRSPDVEIWQVRDRDGRIWWHGHDPVSGRSIHAVTEAEIRCWLEQRWHLYPGSSRRID
ncbi:hypothetical protein [Almyronema epifaneia]|uniref:Uncharacterized protein n=1 Tax=Almyronema epifaneia S1 TaxID=2991925 RepID=A0ABW6IIZ8_9CYAN